MPHVFTSSAVWNLPVGKGQWKHPTGALGALLNDWQLSGVLTLQSGRPVVVTQATNNNAYSMGGPSPGYMGSQIRGMGTSVGTFGYWGTRPCK